MAFSEEVLDEILKDYQGSDDLQLTKARVERTMEVELTEQLGYAKHERAEKPTINRLNGNTAKELKTDHGPKEIAVPRDHFAVSNTRPVSILMLRIYNVYSKRTE
jgi:putative transposase